MPDVEFGKMKLSFLSSRILGAPLATNGFHPNGLQEMYTKLSYQGSLRRSKLGFLEKLEGNQFLACPDCRASISRPTRGAPQTILSAFTSAALRQADLSHDSSPFSAEIQGRVANPFIYLSIFGRVCKNHRLHCKSVLDPSD
jgi:hypothetical protein